MVSIFSLSNSYQYCLKIILSQGGSFSQRKKYSEQFYKIWTPEPSNVFFQITMDSDASQINTKLNQICLQGMGCNDCSSSWDKKPV